MSKREPKHNPEIHRRREEARKYAEARRIQQQKIQEAREREEHIRKLREIREKWKNS